MKSIHKSVLLWHSAHEMFALVSDVPRYPEFLPWCSAGVVLEQHEQGMVASIGMSMAGMKKSFTTRNTHVEDRRIQLELIDGPFSHLDGIWDFKPVGDGSQRACRVDFTLVTALPVTPWPRWWGRCSIRSRPIWSMPSSSAPIRSMANDA